MHVKANQRTLSRRIPVALPQFLRGKFLQGVLLYGDATTLSDIMSFPTRCPHSLTDVRILVMAPITNVIAPNKVNGFFSKQDGVPRSELGWAGVFSKPCF